MDKLKLMTIIGTRPEIIRLSEIIKKCDSYFNHVLVHTGQNYDYTLNKIFFEEFSLREPDFYLNAAEKSLGDTMGNILSKSYELMVKERPDAVLVLGDTNSCLSIICAKRLHIPTFHIEAGNRCFDENLPEEINRKIIDHVSDVNMCYSEHARRYLLKEGRPMERTFVIGSPMAEVLSVQYQNIINSDVIHRLHLKKSSYILLSAHREENIDNADNFIDIMNTVNALAQKYDMPILYSCHPRSHKMIEKRKFKFDSRVILHEPLGFIDYNNLQLNSFCVISDSGTLPEESAFYRTKNNEIASVSIRTSTERPEAVDKGIFVLAGTNEKEIMQAVEIAVTMKKNSDSGCAVPDYTDENVSTKVIKIIQSYTGIVNQMVWRKR